LWFGGINGFELGSVIKEALKPGFAYTDVKNTAENKKSPTVTYCVHLLLSEFQDGG
jgi:hypothetical protein